MSSQLSLAELREKAEVLGLEGEEVINFVNKQQELYRNDTETERAALCEEAEREARS